MYLMRAKEALKRPHVLNSLIFLLFAATAVVIVTFLQVDFWRFDSLYYQHSYRTKLTSEGRWLIFLLFDFLKATPAKVALCLQLFSIAWFSFQVSYRINTDKHMSVVFTLFVLSVPQFYMQMLWPVVAVPAFCFLAITPFLKDRLKTPVFFIVTAIYFFSTFSFFYFLMPLLFISNYLKMEENEKKAEAIMFFGLLIQWIAAFFIGYVVANLIVYFISGNYVELAQWRQPNPVTDTASLINNVKRIAMFFTKHMAWFAAIINPYLAVYILFYLLFNVKKTPFKITILCVVSAIAVYVSTVMHGIVISNRTVFTFFVATAVFFILPQNNQWNRFGNLLFLGIISLTSLHFVYVNTKTYIEYFDMYKSKIEPHLNEIETQHKGIIWIGNYKDLAGIAKKNLASEYRMGEPTNTVLQTAIPIVRYFNLKPAVMCSLPSNPKGYIQLCETYTERTKIEFEDDQIDISNIQISEIDNWLVIYVNEH